MDIKYKIKFYSDWHCGSGFSSGADLDLLVIKNKKKLPFVPGKTIKGLLREAVEEINTFSGKKNDEQIRQVFGVSDTNENAIQGCCFFTNASLKDNLSEAITNDKLQEHLYRTIASTAIDENGVADAHSLRKMEVTIPCDLYGEILNVPDDFASVLEDGLKYIKRLGQNRNRGLGRCSITVWEGGSQ